MSAYGMNPTFGNKEGYKSWIKTWKKMYKKLSKEIRDLKSLIKLLQKSCSSDSSKKQSELYYKQIMAHKMNYMLGDAKERIKRIYKMQEDLKIQFNSFPITIENCKTIDFHFNKASLVFDFMPEWIIKTKGKTYYVRDVQSNAFWTTKNLDKGSTKGLIRIKNGKLILKEESAFIEKIKDEET